MRYRRRDHHDAMLLKDATFDNISHTLADDSSRHSPISLLYIWSVRRTNRNPNPLSSMLKLRSGLPTTHTAARYSTNVRNQGQQYTLPGKGKYGWVCNVLWTSCHRKRFETFSCNTSLLCCHRRLSTAEVETNEPSQQHLWLTQRQLSSANQSETL